MVGGGETEKDPSGFTVDTLRVLHDDDMRAVYRYMAEVVARLEQHVADLDRRYEQRFRSQEQAIGKAEAATEARFASVNEFRQQLNDQALRFMPRAEAEQRTSTNTDRISLFETRTSEALARINSRLDLTAGRSNGLDKGWGYVVGAAGLIAAVVAVVIAFTR